MKGKIFLITLVAIGAGLGSAAWAAARPLAEIAEPPPVSAVAAPQAATASVMAPIGEVDIGQTFPVRACQETTSRFGCCTQVYGTASERGRRV